MSSTHRISNVHSPRPAPILAASVLLVLGIGAPNAWAELVIEAEHAAVRSEGGPAGPGVWNLWSNGRVGEYLEIRQAGTYKITVRAYGSPAAGRIRN